MESLFHIPPGSPLAAVNMEPERHNVWNEYFELFSSHPLWNSRLDGFLEDMEQQEKDSLHQEHDNKDSEDYRMTRQYKQDADKPDERSAKKPYVNFLEKEKKRNFHIELASISHLSFLHLRQFFSFSCSMADSWDFLFCWAVRIAAVLLFLLPSFFPISDSRFQLSWPELLRHFMAAPSY